MTTINKVIDADTIQSSDGITRRVAGIDTGETKHPTKPVEQRGVEASEFANVAFPEGADVEATSYSQDHFGRDVSSVTKLVGDTEIDMGLVMLDQGHSDYYTKYGEHPDPELHDQYKQYWTKFAPYQYGEIVAPKSPEFMADMGAKQKAFTNAYQALKAGTGTQEQADAAMANLYGDGQAIMAYRQQLFQEAGHSTAEGSDRALHDAILKGDPELREQYNKAVRNRTISVGVDKTVDEVVEPEKTVLENIGTTFHMFNSTMQLAEVSALNQVRLNGTDEDMPEDFLTGVPEQYHAELLSEHSRFGSDAATVRKSQLVKDLEVNKDFENMSLGEQLAYGVGAVITDPTTYMMAGPALKTGTATRALIMGKTAAVTTPKKWAAYAGGFAVTGAMEGAAFNSSRLAGDFTYTAEGFGMDVLMDAGFGVALGGLFQGAKFGGGKLLSKYGTEARTARAAEVKEKDDFIENDAQEPVPNEPELIEAAEKAVSWDEAQQNAKKLVRDTQEFTQFQEIGEVSAKGFSKASETLETTFPPKSPLRYLINSQRGLNRKQLGPEERKIADKLNADIIRLAARYPDGNIPKNVVQELQEVTFKQKVFNRNNAMADILKGETADPLTTLTKYNKVLRNLDVWQGEDVLPVTAQEFSKRNENLLTLDYTAGEDVFQLNQGVGNEISFIKDTIELFNMAHKKQDPAFTAQVEDLAGMVSNRLEQMEFGIREDFADSARNFGKVELSAKEVFDTLKAEGLSPRTLEWEARKKELKEGGATISADVQRVGELKQFESRQDNQLMGSDNAYSTGKENLTLVSKDFTQDLLPRSFTETTTQNAYKTPDLQTLTELRERLRSNVMKKTGVLDVKGITETRVQKKRLVAIKKALLNDKVKVIDRMVKSQDVRNLVEVIRVSHVIADEAKREAAKAAKEATERKAANKEMIDGVRENLIKPEPVRALTDEDAEALFNPTQAEPEVVEEAQSIVKKSLTKLQEQQAEAVATELSTFVKSGEMKATEQAMKATGKLGKLAAAANMRVFNDMAFNLTKSKLTAAKYVGARLTESGRGFGGKQRRRHTAGLIRDTEATKSLIQAMPSYVKNIDDYAAEQGANAVGRLQAQQAAGADNKLAKQFHRDVFTVQEYRRQGKQVPAKMSQSVLKFVDDFDKYMDYNHKTLVENNIAGYSADRKINHYIPHVWGTGQMKGAISKHGEEQVVELLTQAYKASSANKSKPIDTATAKEQATSMIEWVLKRDATEDQFMPAVDARAKTRQELDTTTTLPNGLSVMDLLNTEVPEIMTKYSNRLGGWVGLSKSTDGMLNSEFSIDALKANLVAEGAEKGVKTKAEEQWLDDIIDLTFGRPTRGGLEDWARSMKDMTVLTRMGGLGAAQAIETGNVLARSTVRLFSDPKTVAKVLGNSFNTPENVQLIRELGDLTGMTDDIEWLQRDSVHLDVNQMDRIKSVREKSMAIAAEAATFGSAKAPLGRLLGKTTMYNLIKKYQSRITKMSFIADVGKHFNSGQGKMGTTRMADLGLTDLDGKDVDLEYAFKNHVEYGDSGVPTKLNIDKWSTAARDKLQYAMHRDESQMIHKNLPGEMPPWMNIPAMSLLMQFKNMPIGAMNKQLGRQAQFADKEAVMSVLMNAAFSGVIRYGKWAALLGTAAAIKGEESRPVNNDLANVQQYVAAFGIFPDVSNIASNGATSFNNGDYEDVLIRNIPVLGLAKDAYDAGTADNTKDRIDAIQGLTPLGNTAYGDVAVMALHELLEDQ